MIDGRASCPGSINMGTEGRMEIAHGPFSISSLGKRNLAVKLTSKQDWLGRMKWPDGTACSI